VIGEVAIVLVGLACAAWAVRADAGWFERHMLHTYSIARSGELWLARGVRGLGAALALLLLVVIRPRIGRWASRHPVPRLLGDVAGVAVGFSLAMATCELVLRIAYPDPRSRLPTPGGMGERDEVTGWRLAPGRTTVLTRHGKTIAYAVDTQGHRAARPDAALDPSWPTLVLAGESMAMGYGLPWEDTLAALLHDRLGLEVANLCVPGDGNDQSDLRVAAALSSLQKPVALVELVLPVQVERNGLYFRPHLSLDANGNLLSRPASSGFLAELRLRWLWNRVGVHGNQRVALTAAILRATARRAAERGARVLFVMLRQKPLRQDDWLERAVFGNPPLPHIVVDLTATDLQSDDPHPNAAATHRMADAIVSALR